MNTKVLQTIRKYNMISAGDTVAVCLSGGADSMSLFHFLRTNRENLDIDLLALHVNHGLREESKQEEIFVKNYCRKFGVECLVFHADMNSREKPQGMSVETWARELRYRFFYQMAEKYGAKLATAHTLSDKAETIIFNLTRGTGLKGASGIPAVRDVIIRPLIECSRNEIEEYCADNNIEYVTDKTNFEDIYSRNKIRLNVIPVLKQINPSVENSLYRFSVESGEIYTFLTQLSDNLYHKSIVKNGFDIDTLKSENPVVTKNFLRNYLDSINCLSQDNIDDIYSALQKESYSRQLSTSWICVIKNGVLKFEKTVDKKEYTPVNVTLSEKITFIDNEYLIYTIPYEEYVQRKKRSTNVLTYYADYDKINGILTLRTRQIGDSFTLIKRGVTKTVKKLFIEDKIPQQDRDSLRVLSDETGSVIWLERYGINKKFALGDNRKSILVIEK